MKRKKPETEMGGGQEGREREGEIEGGDKDLAICKCQTCWQLKRVDNRSCRITDFGMHFRAGVYSNWYFPLHVWIRRGRARAIHWPGIRRGHFARPHLRVRLYARPHPRPKIFGTATDDGEMTGIRPYKETRTTC